MLDIRCRHLARYLVNWSIFREKKLDHFSLKNFFKIKKMKFKEIISKKSLKKTFFFGKNILHVVQILQNP